MLPKVLIVSPDTRLREELAILLLKESVLVDVAVGIAEARAHLCERQSPDVVLLDVLAGDWDGGDLGLPGCDAVPELVSLGGTGGSLARPRCTSDSVELAAMVAARAKKRAGPANRVGDHEHGAAA